MRLTAYAVHAIFLVVVEIIGTDEFEAWYLKLNEEETSLVDRLVGLLQGTGIQLGYSYTSAMQGTKYALRELRAKSATNPIRIFYAFDRTRAAVLLIGGNKKGDDRFYERMVPL